MAATTSRRLAVLEIARANLPGLETVVRPITPGAPQVLFEALTRDEFDPDTPLVEGVNPGGVTVTVVGIVVGAVRVL